MTSPVRRPGRPLADLLEWLESGSAFGVAEIGLSPYVRVEDFTDSGTYVIRAEMPGIDPDKDVEVSIAGDLLTIRGERREEQEEKNHREFHYGQFSRTVTLPRSARTSEVTADYKDGVLEVRVPMGDEEPAVQTIPVQRAGT
jgi:HSP20 family molecular chaperone IbpA